MFHLKAAARERRLRAFRPGTLSNYTSSMVLYLQFCIVHSVDPAAASLEDIAAFIEWLVIGQLAVGTVKNYVAAIKALYHWWDKVSIIKALDSHTWRLTMRALAHTVRPPADRRAAMSPRHLCILLQTCLTQERYAPLAVALSLGFFAYIRVSNLAPPSLTDFDPSRHSTIMDVVDVGDTLLFHLKWSKTRQSTRHPFVIPVPALGESPLCPVRVWRRYLTLLAVPSENSCHPLLVTTDDPRGQVITISALRAMFREILSLAQLHLFGYTPHSLRRGGATFSFQAGVALDAIKHHGTWRSSAVEAYLFNLPALASPVASNFRALLHNFQV